MENEQRDIKGANFRVFKKQTRNRLRQVRLLLNQVEDATRELKNKKIVKPDVDRQLARFPIIEEELRALLAFSTDLWENGARTNKETAVNVAESSNPATPCGSSEWIHQNWLCACRKKELAEANRRAEMQQGGETPEQRREQARAAWKRVEMQQSAKKSA
jgi:hypothetical protein